MSQSEDEGFKAPMILIDAFQSGRPAAPTQRTYCRSRVTIHVKCSDSYEDVAHAPERGKKMVAPKNPPLNALVCAQHPPHPLKANWLSLLIDTLLNEFNKK